MNIQVIYYLKDDKILYFRQKDKTLIADSNLASRWQTKQAAQKVLDSLENKVLPDETSQSLTHLRVGSLTELERSSELTNVSEDFINDLLTMDQQDFYNLFDDITRFILALPKLKEKLREDLSYHDGPVLQDILHTLEFKDIDSTESCQLFTMLKDSRKSRRLVKDKLQLLDTLMPDELDGNNKINLNTTQKAQELLPKLRENKRNYHYRTKIIPKKIKELTPNE